MRKTGNHGEPLIDDSESVEKDHKFITRLDERKNDQGLMQKVSQS